MQIIVLFFLKICIYAIFVVILQPNFNLAYCGLMTIAIFGNAMKSNTLVEVRHILDFMTEKGIHVLLSQELRQELNLRLRINSPLYNHFTTNP